MMQFRCFAAAVLAVLAMSAAHAQWGWTDSKGNRQFSDQPPPPDVPEKAIFKRPPGTTIGQPNYTSVKLGDDDLKKAAAAAAANAASAPAAAASKPKDPNEEFKKRQEEKAKAEAEAQKVAQDNAKRNAECERAKGYLRSLQDGTRIARTDAQGNRTFLDDAERAREMQRLQSDVASKCK